MENDQYLLKLSAYHNLSIGFKAYLGFTLQETFFNRLQRVCIAQTDLGGYCYLAKGSARLYVYDEESEQEITLLFFPASCMLSELKATASYLKGAVYLEFMENAVLYSIPENHMGNIHKLFMESVILTAAITAETMGKTITAVTDLKLFHADLRLKKLLEYFPSIFSVAAVKDVASYLGIHPTTLSAMRKR